MTKHDNPFHMRQYRGSFFDLMGGRTRLPKTEPRGTTAQARSQARRLRFTPSPLWPKCGQENLKSRIARVLDALSNVGDLLG